MLDDHLPRARARPASTTQVASRLVRSTSRTCRLRATPPQPTCRVKPRHASPRLATSTGAASTGQDSPRLTVARRADPPPRVTSALSTWLPPCCPRAGWLTDDPGAPWLSQATSHTRARRVRSRCRRPHAARRYARRQIRACPRMACRHPLALLPSPIRLDSAPRHSTGVATCRSSLQLAPPRRLPMTMQPRSSPGVSTCPRRASRGMPAPPT